MAIKHIQLPVSRESLANVNKEREEKAWLLFANLHVEQLDLLDKSHNNGWQIISDHISPMIDGLVMIHFILWKPNDLP